MDDYEIKSYFTKLGQDIELYSQGMTNISNSVIDGYDSLESLSNANYTSDFAWKKIAKCLCNIILHSGYDTANVKQAAALYASIATKENDLSDFDRNVMKKSASTALKALSGVTGLMGSGFASVGAMIPVLSALLGGAYYLGEKGLKEDTKSIEKDKARTMTYRALTADLVKRLHEQGLTDEEIENL